MKNLINKTMKKITERNLENSANSLCRFIFHQPKAPVGLEKFSKIK